MAQRSADKRDGTLRDIARIGASLEQLFLSYKKGELPYIYIANLLELLFQSARTRVCILKAEAAQAEQDFSLSGVDNLIVFSTFRKPEIYDVFREKLVEKLSSASDRHHFLESECERLEGEEGHFYICLPRVHPEIDNDKVVLDRAASKEAYYRLTTLLRILEDASRGWGLDMLDELYQHFAKVPANRNASCKLPCHPQKAPVDIRMTQYLQVDPLKTVSLDDDFLKPIYDWVDYIYGFNSETPLMQVAKPDDADVALNLSNLFFFVKVNNLEESGHCANDCDSFRVKLVCPPKQRRQLSKFYHEHREHECQWHTPEGQCRINGMGECLFSRYWQEAPGADAGDKAIIKHYAPVWDKLDESSHSDYSKSELAFRSSSILFDRRAKGQLGRVDGSNPRDQVSACLAYRMLPDLSEEENAEDRVPQMMFVPIYAGSTPLVMAATVVNARLPEPLNSQLTEWRHSYLFAGHVFQSMAGRLKEAARRAYLNSATDLFEDLYAVFDKGDLTEACLLQSLNSELDLLSKYYPYHKIVLAKSDLDVINSERLDILKTQRGLVLQVCLEENPYWCHFSDKSFFLVEDVARKFRTAMARDAAEKTWEQAEWHKFCLWHVDTLGRLPTSKANWRGQAKHLGWDGTPGHCDQLPDSANDDELDDN